MIDGFKCTCVGLDADLWKHNKLLDFALTVSERTGEVSQRKEAKVNGVTFAISPTKSGVLSCSLAGSLHKYKNGGVQNWDDFHITEMRDTLDELADTYNIKLDNALLHRVEVGVNIPLNYKPQRIIKSAICHKGEPFKSISKKGEFLGVICEHTDYDIKLYDKSYQQRISDVGYILRFEIKFKRVRMLAACGIYSLSDLKKRECLENVLPILISKLKEIVFFDFYADTDGLTDKQKLRWERFSNIHYWESLNRKQYYNARVLFAELTKKYGAKDGAELLAEKVSNKYQELLEIKQKTVGQFPQLSTDGKQSKTGTISNLEYMLENVPFGGVELQGKNNCENEPKNTTEKRYCKTCGREITHQRAGSLFCSERLYGKEAKRCRNKDSNRRMIVKRKIVNAMKKERTLRITYEVDGEYYTDTLQANELAITRDWLDRVVNVAVLDERTIDDEKKAKECLTKYLIDK